MIDPGATGHQTAGPQRLNDSILGFIRWLASVGALGIVLFALQYGWTLKTLAVVGVAIPLCGAALTTGGLVGFLFGIPRTSWHGGRRTDTANRGDAPDNAVSNGSANGSPFVAGSTGAVLVRDVEYFANTNLEQISDWLTKILVGVGLTQLIRLPDYLWRLGATVQTALGSPPPVGGGVFAQATIVYYAVCGFLYGFLWARLELANAMSNNDIGVLDAHIRRRLDEQSRTDAALLTLVDRQLNPAAGVRPPTTSEIVAAMRAASDTARAQVFAAARRARREGYRDHDVGKVGRALPVLDALTTTAAGPAPHAWYAQLGYTLKDANEDWVGAEDALSKAITARDAAGVKGYGVYEFNRAICRIKRDPEFQAGRASADARRTLIAADLAAADATFHPETPEPAIERWRALNDAGAPGAVAQPATGPSADVAAMAPPSAS